MIKKRISFLLLFIFIVSAASAQYNFGRRNYTRNNPMKKYPAIGMGGGVTMHFGDMGSSTTGVIQPAGNFKFDYRVSRMLALEVNATAGMLKETYSNYTHMKYDFESTFGQAYINFRLHLDYMFNMQPTAMVSPYVATGIGYMVFETYNNIKNPAGVPYEFNETGITLGGQPMTRDDNFETSANDIVTQSLDNSTLLFPVTAGLKFQFTEYFEMNVEGTLFYTNTDHIDGSISFNEGPNGTLQPSRYNKNNDAFFYTSVTLMYSFGFNPYRRTKRYRPKVRPSF